MWGHSEGPYGMHALVKKSEVADILKLPSPGPWPT